jgi:hypothetical protein
MRRLPFQMPDDGARTLGSIPSKLDSQLSLLPTRISTIYPSQPIGKHIRFHCSGDDGQTYHCKSDVDSRPIRATEWISQSLAHHLGIAVPNFRIMEDRDGETYFGSQEHIKTASLFKLQDLLTRKTLVNELGGPSGPLSWLGPRLSGLYALDMFLNNNDRNPRNFVLLEDAVPNILCAIDFADARLEDITSDRFPVATSNTVCNGKFFESVHGFSVDSALEMIDRIGAIPVSTIDGIIGKMPNDWMLDGQKHQFREAWFGSRLEPRLSALRAGIKDGSRR